MTPQRSTPPGGGAGKRLAGSTFGENYTTTLADTLAAHGLTLPDNAEPGRLVRMPGAGKQPSNDAGWLKIFPDYQGAVFGDWSTGLKGTWQARKPANDDELQRWRKMAEQAQKEAAAKDAEKARKAAKTAADTWAEASDVDDLHGYLVSRGTQAHGLRQDGDDLLIPIYVNGELSSLQRITPNGRKKFQFGGKTTGGFYLIEDPAECVIIAEGYATAASIHEATGEAVAVAFNAGNLKAVAEAMRAKYPDTAITIAADDDRHLEINRGIQDATEAAQAVSGLLATPGRDGDFNDLHQADGAEAVAERIKSAAPITRRGLGTSEHIAITTQLSTIDPEPIRWLWPNRIARGKLTMVAGDPKLGKSLITADLTARITAALAWPDNAGIAPRGNVIFASAEDDPSDTIRPRIEAAGGDVSRVFIIGTVTDLDKEGMPYERGFNLRNDAHRLETEIERIGDIAAVIVDPVTAYLGGTDSHKNAEVRELLSPLSRLAAAHNVAVIAVSHLNKGSGTNALYRVSGSLAFTAAARTCWLVAKDQNDEQRRLMLPSGSNIAPDIGGLAYRIATTDTEVGEVPVLEWEPDPVDVDATDALTPDSEEKTERQEAAEWLRELILEGRMKSQDVQKAAKVAGWSWRTVQRARKIAGVETKREGFGKGAVYWWDMRATEPPCKKGGIHGTHGTHDQPRGFQDDHADHARHACHEKHTGTHGTDDEEEIEI